MTCPVADRIVPDPCAEPDRTGLVGLDACVVILFSSACASVPSGGKTIAWTEVAVAVSTRIEKESMSRASARSERKRVLYVFIRFALATFAPCEILGEVSGQRAGGYVPVPLAKKKRGAGAHLRGERDVDILIWSLVSRGRA